MMNTTTVSGIAIIQSSQKSCDTMIWCGASSFKSMNWLPKMEATVLSGVKRSIITAIVFILWFSDFITKGT
jgi:hypothetical protein